MFVNTMPRYEILSEDAMEVLDRGWRRIVTELGVEFMLPEAVELFRAAGQTVEGDHLVKLDPDFILEQVAKAPREFDLAARNPERTCHIGGDHMVFAPVYGPPFVREGDVRRDATMADYENFVKLAHVFPELDSPGGTVVEPNDRPLDSRHLRHGVRAPDASATSRTWARSSRAPTRSTRSRWARSPSAACRSRRSRSR